MADQPSHATAGRGLPDGALSLLMAYVRYGVTDAATPVGRRQMIVNGATIAAMIAHLFFALWFAAIGSAGLRPTIVVLVIAVAALAPTPLLHRFGQIAAAAYFVGVVSVAALVYGFQVGVPPGSHYFMLTGSAMIVLFGSSRPWPAIGACVAMTSVFCLVEFFASPSTPMPSELVRLNRLFCILGTVLIVLVALYYAARLGDDAEAALEREYARSEGLLLNLMPASIASRLKAEPQKIIADQFDSVTILFADIVDFTPRAGRMSPEAIVGFLNLVFSEFDRLAEKYRLEKIKTIGDAYMVAGGMPDRRTGHAAAVAEMALDMIEATRRLSKDFGEELAVRIGIHSGPAVAGVIGTRKLFYDVWGDTVNTASRMESHGSAGRIQVTQAAKAVLGDGFDFEERGLVPIKGKGEMRLFYLTGRRRDA